jgi:hypothetical protein
MGLGGCEMRKQINKTFWKGFVIAAISGGWTIAFVAGLPYYYRMASALLGFFFVLALLLFTHRNSN